MAHRLLGSKISLNVDTVLTQVFSRESEGSESAANIELYCVLVDIESLIHNQLT
jgi:hypothetical protein